jgi:hypothetical protein
MKMNRNFRVFTDLESLEPEVPVICLVTGGVSARRERRYACFCPLARPILGKLAVPLYAVRQNFFSSPISSMVQGSAWSLILPI